MPKPRKTLVSLEATPYYRCVSRCVRRAFLCGEDAHSGKSYDHRRQWIQDRMRQLAAAFAVDVCAYAAMSNHHHVVFHVDRAQAEAWVDADVVRRWRAIFKGDPLAQRFLDGHALSPAAQEVNRGVTLAADRYQLVYAVVE